MYDVLIVGTGAAGLSAGLYAGRYLLKTAVIGAEFGGETAKAGVIWNYPGNKDIDGYELMTIFRSQAEAVGSKVVDDKVEKVEKIENGFRVHAAGVAYDGKTLVLAMGAERRKLGIPRELELKGNGVHYCVTCDGPLYSGKTIVMVGGGDASVKGVNLAAQYAKKIYLLAREKSLNAEPINYQEMLALGDKVEILLATEVVEILGAKRVEGVRLSRSYNGADTLPADALFIEIGADPNREFPESLGVGVDARGYIVVNNEMAANIPGVFAAGDATSFFGTFKQTITAAAQGAVAATGAYTHIKRLG